jgi:glucose/arabinose dehydrogenase
MRGDAAARFADPLVSVLRSFLDELRSARPLGVRLSSLPAPTSRPGFEPPVYYWDPVIAPSGAQFYTGDAFPDWRGNLFVGGLKDGRLVRLTIEDGRVTGEEHLLAGRGQRVRDVRQGPDGALHVITDEADGELWRLTPRG